MAKDTEDRIIYGFYVPEDEKFYYLETGMSRASTSIERLRQILLARDIITMIGAPKHQMMTHQEASAKGYTFEPVFTNQHVKAQWIEQQTAKQSVGKIWR